MDGGLSAQEVSYGDLRGLRRVSFMRGVRRFLTLSHVGSSSLYVATLPFDTFSLRSTLF